MLKPVIVVLLFASALGAHFMWTYHVVIDAAVAANTLQTDWHEVQDLVTPRLGLVLLVGAAVPSWMVWNAAVDHRPWRQQALRNLTGVVASLLLLVAMALLSFQPLASTMRNHKELRYLLNPLNPYAWRERLRAAETKGPVLPVGLDAKVVAAQARGRACWCWSWARPVAAATSA